MRTGAAVVFALAAALVLAMSASAQPPGGKGGKGFPGGPGGFGMRAAPGELMPGFIQEQLKLTDDQKKQMADLQKEVDARLDKLLTEEQRTQLKQLKDRGGRGFPGGFGGPGGKGGFPGKGGDGKRGKDGFPGKGGPPVKKGDGV
jgi:Spy/CpxP family protein refolding chaperone